MIHTVLADDEVLARQKLRQLLRNEPEIDVVGEGATASETIDLVRAAKPQLLFLDIQMPGMDGFEIATELCSGKLSPKPHIIFTTAHDQYALRAFENSRRGLSPQAVHPGAPLLCRRTCPQRNPSQ